jgi:hypothetical protein
VDNEDVWLVDGFSVFESVSNDFLGGWLGDQLDGLDDTWDNGMFDTGVFTFGVFSDQDGVDILVWGVVTGDGLTWTDVGEQVEGSSQGQVHGGVTFTDWGGQWTLQGNQVLVDGVDSWLRQGGLTVNQQWGDVDWFPVNWDLSGSVDVLDGLGDFWTDTVTFNQGNGVFTIRARLTGELTGDVRSSKELLGGSGDWNRSGDLSKHCVKWVSVNG